MQRCATSSSSGLKRFSFRRQEKEGMVRTGSALFHVIAVCNIAMYNACNQQLDKNNMLWVSDMTNERVAILNTKTDKVDETPETGLKPARVVFVTH